MPDWTQAYCGAPPAPEAIATRWNLDPVLIVVLLCAAAAVWLSQRLTLKSANGQLFAVGSAVLALALLSPLCALSVSLFSARVAQHIVITLIAAPLLAVAMPADASVRRMPLLMAALFAITMWLWHAPGPYAATFTSAAAYWAMHVSMLVSAVLLWSALAGPAPLSAAGAALFTAMQMSLLGALLTFAPAPLFAPHFGTTMVWGLSALDDQRLGALLLWVPGGALFAALSLRPLLAIVRGGAEARA